MNDDFPVARGAVGAVAPSEHNIPGGHAVQVEDDVLVTYDPAVHSEHVLAPDKSSEKKKTVEHTSGRRKRLTEEKKRSSLLAHEPAVELNEPRGHCVHALAPPSANIPTVQGDCTVAEHDEPAAHGVATDKPAL